MFKAIAGVAVPSVLGGAGLLYSPLGALTEQISYQEAYILEVGVAFDPTAVRAALPEGLEPLHGFTGGIAIYEARGVRMFGISPRSLRAMSGST